MGTQDGDMWTGKAEPRREISPKAVRDGMNATVLIGDARLHCGDCLDVMRGMEAESVSAFCTDPPYGLTPDGKTHELGHPSWTDHTGAARRGGFMGKQWDHGVPGIPFWTEALRVAKPGAFLLAFGGTRTFHRLACAIEDAGWEVRDCLMWLYGQGFPKSHDLSKAIDKAAGAEREVVGQKYADRYPNGPGGNSFTVGGGPDGTRTAERTLITAPATTLARLWSGYGTALKPAYEPILVCMKPLDGTFAENALKHGIAGINVDGCRIPSPENPTALRRSYGFAPNDEKAAESERRGALRDRSDPIAKALPHPADSLGRWPANLVLDEETGRALDRQSGERPAGSWNRTRGMRPFNNDGKDTGYETQPGIQDSSGVSRFFFCAKASRAEREWGLEGMPVRDVHRYGAGIGEGLTPEAPARNRNVHPTCKTLSLMRWLVRLVKPPVGGIVCDPFMGSGTTGMACAEEGVAFVGMEIDPEYFEIARRRIEAAQQQLRLPI